MDSNDLKKFLSTVSPFTALPATEVDRLASLSNQKSFDKAQTIFSEGDPADSVWILREGRVQIFKYTSSGRPFAIESLGPGELFGTLCRLGNQARAYPCTAVTATPASVIRILDRTFLEFYNKHPALVLGVCALCSQRLNEMQGMSCSSQEPVEKRIATVLMQLRKSQGVSLKITKREIAELAGTTVETTIRTMSVFAKRGWIASTRGQIQIRTPDLIQKLVDDAR